MTHPIRTLVIDDEMLARENLRIRLSPVPDIEVIGECANAVEALAAIRRDQPELIFLDIQMPGQDGFELLEELTPEETPVVVFVTAYDEYALRAFQVHALDYLLKPIDDKRLSETLASVRDRISVLRRRGPAGEGEAATLSGSWETARPPHHPGEGGQGAETGCLERLVIKMGGRIFFIRCEDIDWIQADGDYMRIHTGSGTHLLRKTLSELERCLDPRRFVRIHRSVIVNVDRIKELRPDSRGDFKVTLKDGKEVKLTRTFRTRLESLLGDSI